LTGKSLVNLPDKNMILHEITLSEQEKEVYSEVFIFSHIYIYSYNLCLFVLMSDHNSIEPLDRFASKFDWRTAGMFLAWFSDSKLCVLTFIYAQIAKFLIYDQVRINGWSNYE